MLYNVPIRLRVGTYKKCCIKFGLTPLNLPRYFLRIPLLTHTQNIAFCTLLNKHFTLPNYNCSIYTGPVHYNLCIYFLIICIEGFRRWSNILWWWKWFKQWRYSNSSGKINLYKACPKKRLSKIFRKDKRCSSIRCPKSPPFKPFHFARIFFWCILVPWIHLLLFFCPLLVIYVIF